MFDPEKEVPSLELCEKLKELGFPQNTGGWYWEIYESIAGKDVEVKYFDYTPEDDLYFTYVKAPTTRELEEWLLSNKIFYQIQFWEDGYVVSPLNIGLLSKRWKADTGANARAEMLIWLVKNGYVSLRKES